MARRPQPNKGDRGGLVSRESMRRIGRVVQHYEHGERNRGGLPLPRAWGDDGGNPIRIGKTTAAWNKGTLATITLYERGTPPNETANSPSETIEDCVNKWADVQADKWVAVALAQNGSYYLVVAECD